MAEGGIYGGCSDYAGAGHGANTAIFSVVNAVLLHPLAYHDADGLVTVMHDGVAPVATGNYLDWQEQSHSFSAMGAADFWRPNLASSNASDSNPAEHLYGMKVTQSLLPMLGVSPLLSRSLRQAKTSWAPIMKWF